MPNAMPDVPDVQCFPVITDLSVIPVKPKEPTPDAPFTSPKPRVMTGSRSPVRVIKARHKLVVLDSDLASLYETTVDAINRAVMRNACCFPRSQCFRLSNDEWHHLQRGITISKGVTCSTVDGHLPSVKIGCLVRGDSDVAASEAAQELHGGVPSGRGEAGY